MSTSYNLRCVTCTVAKGETVESWLDDCRQPVVLELAIAHRQAFEKLAAFMALPAYSWFDGEDRGPTRMLAPFFAEHAGHELKVFDEYGGDWARRDEMCECGHAFSRHYSNGCGWSGPTDHHCAAHEFRAAV